MRVAATFNRILALVGVTVDSVVLEGEDLVAQIHLRRRRPVCPCGRRCGRYDSAVRRWRHLDVGPRKLFLQARIARVWCAKCRRVRTERVHFARDGARHTKAFDDLVLWCAQRMDKSAVASLCRIGWRSVDAMVSRAVQGLELASLPDPRRIGVDEINYAARGGYLTVVVDHGNGGRVIWVGEGRKAATLGTFFEALGPEKTAAIEAITMDLGAAYQSAAMTYAPGARVCLDPFHVIKACNGALDKVRRRGQGKGPTARSPQGRSLRWALMKDPERLSSAEQTILADLAQHNSDLWLAWELKEQLRGLYVLEDPAHAPAYLDRWCERAETSGVGPMMALSRMIGFHREGILAAIELGLSNSRLEGMNSKIRLINHRGYGHHSAAALIAMIHLACGLLVVAPPFL